VLNKNTVSTKSEKMTINKASVKLIWNDHGTAGGNLVKDEYGKVTKYIKFIRHDLLDDKILTKVVKECDLVFHLAGNVYVRKGHLNTEVDFLNNIVATRNVLESMRDNDNCKKIIFTSSSVVYGEPLVIPTPENYGPLNPISLYGASKLAYKALLSGYVGTCGIEAVIFRLANVVGSSSGHGCNI